MSSPPERNKKLVAIQEKWAEKNVRSSLGQVAKRLRAIKWYSEDEEEHW